MGILIGLETGGFWSAAMRGRVRSMKFLKIDMNKCNGGRDCRHECEIACAEKVIKCDDSAFAALHIRNGSDGEIQAILCDQCGDCVVVCSSDALKRNKLGVVVLDKKICVGCYMCMGFCEKGAFQRIPGRLLPHKCIACLICVRACPLGALEIAEGPEPESRIL